MADQAGDSLIVAEYLRRKDAGENVDVQSLVQKFPDQADALRSYLDNEAMFSSEDQLSSQFGLGAKGQETTNSMFEESSETIAPKSMSVDGSSNKETMFGRYRIDKELGAGAMGAVYLAFDTKLERSVALKIPKMMALSGEEFLERFKREAQSAAKLTHPNICQVLDFGEENNLPFITMNYIDGHPLSRFVGTDAYKDQKQVAQTVQTIALALENAHQNNVIHRDLKPGNVLVDLAGNLSVTDFGLARKLDQSEDTRMTQDGVLLGTPAYMAPEQMEGRQDDVGAQSDIYSLGIILFELLTGEIPFKGTITSIIAQVARDQPPKPSSLRSDIDPRLEELCLQMIEKKKEDRPVSMQAVADSLAVWLDAGSPEAKEAEEKKKKRLLKYESAKQQIIELLKQGQFAKAINALEKMSKVKSASVAEYVAWAKKELPNAKAMPKKFKEGIPAVIETAKQLVEKHDYQQAIDILNQLPEDYRNDVVTSLIHQATELQEEADLLLMDLKNAVRKKQYDHIEENLKRYLEIKPGSRFAKGLWESLQSYSEIPKGKREYQFDEKGRLQPLLEDSLAKPLFKIAVAGVFVFALTLWGVLSYLNSGAEISDEGRTDGSFAQTVTTTPSDAEWVSLFNGQDFTGWETYESGQDISKAWKVENGKLVYIPNFDNVYLMTSKEYGNYELEFEWKVTKDANGGVMYLVQKGVDVGYKAGLEYQILDDTIEPEPNGKAEEHLNKMKSVPERSAGSLYQISGTLDKKLNPVGEWNSAKIVVQGDRIEHWLNGQKIVDFDLGSDKWSFSPKAKVLGDKRSGHIMLQGLHSSEHSYRNIRIRELNNSTNPSQVSSAYQGRNDYDSIATGVWTNLFEIDPPKSDGDKIIYKNGSLVLKNGSIGFTKLKAKNVILRAKVKEINSFQSTLTIGYKNESNAPAYATWQRAKGKGNGRGVGIGRNENSKWADLANQLGQKNGMSERVYDADGFFEFALVAIDNRISSYVSGKKVFEVEAEKYQGGSFAFESRYGANIFKDVQVMLLDNPSRNDYDNIATGTWSKVTDFKTTEDDKGKVNFANGQFVIGEGANVYLPQYRGRNMIIRAKYKDDTMAKFVIYSRVNEVEKSIDSFGAWLHTNSGGRIPVMGIGLNLDRKFITLKDSQNIEKNTTQAVVDEQGFVELAFSLVENRLSSYINGKKRFEVVNDTLTSGFPIFRTQGDNGIVKDVQIMILDEAPSSNAKNDIPFQEFKNAKPITELNKDLPVNAFPSLTSDGLGIVWTRESETLSTIYQAVRKTPSDNFGSIRRINQGYRLATISSDGLELICLPKGKSGFKKLLSSVRRKNTNDAFSTPIIISSLTSIGRPKVTSLTPDGLKMYVHRISQPDPKFNVITRKNLSSPWEEPQWITVEGDLPDGHQVAAPSISADGKHLYFVYSEVVDRTVRFAAMADATGDPTKFINARNVLLDGERFEAQSVHYCQATEELLFTKLTSSAPNRKMEIWVASKASDKQASKAEWKSLFNGNDLTGWRHQFNSSKWTVENNEIVPKPGSDGGILATDGVYGDFELELEFNPANAANSGVFIRMPDTGNKSGADFLEVQILDDNFRKNKKLAPTKVTGALYNIAPVTTKANVKANQWNTMRIEAVGSRIQIWVNGQSQKVVDVNLEEKIKTLNELSKALKQNALLPAGRIGFQSHSKTRVRFRNIRIKERNGNFKTSSIDTPTTKSTNTLNSDIPKPLYRKSKTIKGYYGQLYQNGTKLMFCRDQGKVHFYDLVSDKETGTLKITDQKIWNLVVNEQGTRLLVEYQNAGDKIGIWDLMSRKELRNYKDTAKNRRRNVMNFNSSGAEFLLSVGAEKFLLCDSNTGQRKEGFNQMKMFLNSKRPVVFSNAVFCNSEIITRTGRGVIQKWSPRTGNLISSAFTPVKNSKNYFFHTGVAFNVVCSSDGKTFVTGGRDKQILIWDSKTLTKKTVLKGHQGGIHALAITPDNNRLISSSSDQTVKIWDLKSGKELESKTFKTEIAVPISISPDGSKFLTSGPGEIAVWQRV